MLEEKINGYMDVFEHPRVSNWLEDLSDNNRLKYNMLVSDNLDYVVRFLGKPSPNSNKVFSKCWYCNYKGLQFKILNNKKQGTVFLVKTITTKEDFIKNNVLGLSVINFLEKFTVDVTGQF